MNKRQFLAGLEKELSGLNKEERQRQLDFYEEMIDDRIDEGMSEETAVANIGTVQGIAAKILSEATPEQMKAKKKIGVLGWIGIVLGALILITVVLAVLFMFDRAEDSGAILDVDDMIEHRLEFEDGWIFGGDAKIDVNSADTVDIVWSCGNIFIDETEGRNIVVKAGKDASLEYQVRNGVLYIETNPEFTSGKSDLRVFIPEDIRQLAELCIVSSGGDVVADGEYFASVDVTVSGGDVRINPNDAAYASVACAGGDVLVELDEDDAFVMNYAVDGGSISVGFDRGFVNESGKGESASYDHSFGRANCLTLNISAADGNVRLMDD